MTRSGRRRARSAGSSKQVRHLVEMADRPNITINVLPADVAAHPGLLGQFMIMEFADDPTVVYVEDRTTGLFLDDPDKVALYTLTAEKLTELALDEQGSLSLLEAIAQLQRQRGRLRRAGARGRYRQGLVIVGSAVARPGDGALRGREWA